VDDSAIVRKLFQQELSKVAGLEVVGTAPDPFVARDYIVKLQPDAVVLDVMMPRMDGITFLRKLMHYHPLPVVVVSSHTPRGGAMAMEALECGAVDVMCKPGPGQELTDLVPDLAERLKEASHIDAKRLAMGLERGSSGQPEAAEGPVHAGEAGASAVVPVEGRVVAMGASTGGTAALEEVLRRLPAGAPPMVVVQHMPNYITRTFAERLDSVSAVDVAEAEDVQALGPGQVLVAPGDRHLLLRGCPGDYHVQIKDGPRVNRSRPSADVLFRSVAKAAGPHGVGVILTGMGEDGARGLLAMHQAGAATLAQDEASCVVFGMPRAAVELGAVDRVVSLADMADAIVRAACEMPRSCP